MKKLLILLLIAIAVNARGQLSQPKDPTAVVNGVFYIFNTTAKTAQVGSGAYWANTYYSGDITVPEKVTYDNASYTVTGVAALAFCDYNSDLTSVTLPNTITSFDVSAFDGTVLKTLVVPNSVKKHRQRLFPVFVSDLDNHRLRGGTIGTSAFAKCKSLTSITIEAANPPTISANTVPADVKKNIVLTVPKGSLAAYKAAANWDGFKEYKEADGGGGGGGGGTGSDEPYTLVDGIYYEMDHTANTASVISGYQAGITQTPIPAW